MNRKKVHAMQQHHQAQCDEAVRVLNLDFPIEVKIGCDDDDVQGEFWPEWVEDKGMTRTLKGFITIADFAKLPKDELIELLTEHILIHELAHALQFRHHEMDDEKQRDDDHDAEFGIHFARAYSQIMLNDAFSLEEAYAMCGLTEAQRAGIIGRLATALEKDNTNE